jgi:acylphosphatase
MRLTKRFYISGRVQGVGFRYFVYEAALREGVGGYVKNLPDGRVEALVEGEASAVARVEAKIRRGPPSAHVETVHAEEEQFSGAYNGFSTR